jgi:hypothetical protein
MPIQEEDDDSGFTDLESQRNLISIKVKTLSNMFHLTIPKKTKVLSFKQKIIKEYLKEEAFGKRIRLIHAGKVLDDAKDISSYKLKQNTCIHAAISDIIRNTNNDNNNNRQNNNQVEEEEEQQIYRGFDRLRHGGVFSREDVEIIRSTFYREVLEYEETQSRRPGEDEAERYYRMEEEWIRRQGPASDFAINVATRRMRHNDNDSNNTEMDRIVQQFLEFQQQIGARRGNANNDTTINNNNDVGGSEDEDAVIRRQRGRGDDDLNSPRSRNRRHIEFVVGFILGFFLGVIMLCFIWDENLSKYQRAGVVTGVAFNLYFQNGTINNHERKGTKNSKQSAVDGSTIDENNNEIVNIATIFH